MMIKKIKILIFIILVMLTSQSAKATLNEELEGMFDGMINSTSGGSYETQRRGVIWLFEISYQILIWFLLCRQMLKLAVVELTCLVGVSHMLTGNSLLN